MHTGMALNTTAPDGLRHKLDELKTAIRAVANTTKNSTADPGSVASMARPRVPPRPGPAQRAIRKAQLSRTPAEQQHCRNDLMRLLVAPER